MTRGNYILMTEAFNGGFRYPLCICKSVTLVLFRRSQQNIRSDVTETSRMKKAFGPMPPIVRISTSKRNHRFARFVVVVDCAIVCRHIRNN